MIVGSAQVVIRALGNKLESDIQKSLDRAGVKAGKSGEKAGTNYTDGITKGIDKKTDNIAEAVAEPIRQAGGKAGEEAGRKASDGITKGLGKNSAAEAAGEKIGRRVGDRVARGFERSRITRVLGSALVKLGIFVPIIGALIGAISALVSGLFAIGAAVGTASASLVALGGVLAAGVQAIGVSVIAFKGVGKAISEGFKGGDIEKFNEALKSIAPAARPFVKELVGLKGELKDIRNAAAAGLFPGLERSLDIVAPLLSRMEGGFRRAGDAVGDAIEIFTGLTAGSGIFRGNFADVAETNNVVIRKLGGAFGELARTVVALLDAAGPLTIRFTEWVERGATSIRKLTEAGNDSGALQSYFAKAGDAAALLGRIFGNLFEGLYDIGKIAQPVGISLLESFEGATENLANFTDNSKNITKTAKYFDGVAKNVRAISSLVGDLGLAFIRMGASPGIAATADAFREIIPQLEEVLTKSVESIGPAIAELVGKLLELFSVLEESGAIRDVITIFTELANALVVVFNIPGIGRGLLYLLEFVAVMKALKLVGKGGGFFFNGVRDGLNTVNKTAKTASTGVVAAQRNIQGANLAINKLGFRGYAAAAVAASKPVERLGNSSLSTRTKIANLATGAGLATKNLGSYVKMGGRAAGGAALFAVAATGVADKVGLSNTALFASVGAIGGFAGVAAGAGIGAAVDFAKAQSALGDATRVANIALNSTSIDQVSQALATQNSAVDKAGSKFSKLGTAVKGYFTGGSAGAGTAVTGLNAEIDAGISKSAQLKQKLKDLTTVQIDIPLKVELQEQVSAMAEIKAQFKEQKIPIKLDLNAEGGTQAVNYLTSLSTTVQNVKAQLGKTSPEFTKGRDAIKSFLKTAGASPAAIDLLTDSLSGIKPKFDEIPADKKVTLTAEDKNLLSLLGLSEEKVNGLTDEHNTALNAFLGDGFSATINESTGRIELIPGEKSTTIGAKTSDSFFGLLSAVINAVGNATKPKTTIISGNPAPLTTLLAKIAAQAPKSPPKVKISGDKGPFQRVLDSISAAGKSVPVNIVAGNISATILKLLPFVKRAVGGFVYGAGTGTSDSIPAMLSNGEYVVKATQAKRFGPLLESINDNKPLPKMLPNMKAEPSVGAKSSSSSAASALRVVHGTVELTPNSRALLHLAAEEVYDDSANYDDSSRGM